VTPCLSVEKIRYVDETHTIDEHGQYFVSILKLALDKTKPQFGAYQLMPVTTPMRQSRQFKGLTTSELDLVWSVTSNQRESQARPIRVPLLKGLIGYRVFMIAKSNAEQFKAIDSLKQLANFTAIQGHDWPDTHILQTAGLKVETAVWHKSMHKLISSGVADYYPRSLLEIFDEIKNSNDPKLQVNPYHVIVYPSAIYFFVNQENHNLANRLEIGLKQAIEDGSFDELFYSFSGHKKALSSFPLKQASIFRIANPLIPKNTPLDDKRLWLQIN
jgi:hypothetical protein